MIFAATNRRVPSIALVEKLDVIQSLILSSVETLVGVKTVPVDM